MGQKEDKSEREDIAQVKEEYIQSPVKGNALLSILKKGIRILRSLLLEKGSPENKESEAYQAALKLNQKNTAFRRSIKNSRKQSAKYFIKGFIRPKKD